MNMTRKKTKKFRGSMTHGRGKKAGRGAGLRGGRGNAGLSKHRIMHLNKYMPNDSFGAYGFKRPQGSTTDNSVINVGKLAEQFPEKTTINLTEEGYDKLLGGGSVSKAFTVTVKQASEAAIEKIKENGGEVTIAE